MSKKRNAEKWIAIMIQPVNQTPETRVGFRRDTDAKAAVKSAMAARSGISLQSTRYTSKPGIRLLIESAVLTALPSLFCSTVTTSWSTIGNEYLQKQQESSAFHACEETPSTNLARGRTSGQTAVDSVAKSETINWKRGNYNNGTTSSSNKFFFFWCEYVSHAPDLCTNPAQLFLNTLVAAIHVINAVQDLPPVPPQARPTPGKPRLANPNTSLQLLKVLRGRARLR